MPRCPLERANKTSRLKARLHRAILSHDKSCNFVTRQVALNFEPVRMAAICRATNRSEIGGCSYARFAVAVKSPFDRSSCRASKSLCVNEALHSQISRSGKMQQAYMRSVSFWGKLTSGSRTCASSSELRKVPILFLCTDRG